jgi:beta-galactosidase
LTASASLASTLGKPVQSQTPKPMEDLGQSYGYILYRTRVNGQTEAMSELVITEVHDYAVILVNGQRAASVDRRLGQDRATFYMPAGAVTLDILVENTGRINFKKDLRQEWKGITRSVALNGRELTGWEIFTLPMTDIAGVKMHDGLSPGPAFYHGQFAVTQVGDTFLDLRGWEKGTVWVNGHHLGRFWQIGPQQTLYVPGPWLRRGTNDVVVFDLGGEGVRSIAGLAAPVLGGH